MRRFGILVLAFTGLISSCAIQREPSYQYNLERFSAKRYAHSKSNSSILVSQVDAAAGYQTEQMRYINKAFALESFAHHAWVASPANLLFPLILQSLQASHYFQAVTAAPYSDRADYRLDSQILRLDQNFLSKPSRIELRVKAVLTRIEDNEILSSRIFRIQKNCAAETPYAGVVAANQAVETLTANLSYFIIQAISRDRSAKA